MGERRARIFDVAAAERQLRSASPEVVVETAFAAFPGELTLSTSLSVEDMVLLDIAMKVRGDRALSVFTLDTGRLPQETYDVLDRARRKYDIEICTMFPDATGVEELVTLKGPNSFLESVDARKECCRIRKVVPLRRALSTAGAWLTGLRAAQSVTRDGLKAVETDVANSEALGRALYKFNPLARVSDDDIWAYAREHAVPTNALHQQGYPSIGCAPCTRAVAAGEDARAGRWWWEDAEHKECGLHARPGAPSPS